MKFLTSCLIAICSVLVFGECRLLTDRGNKLVDELLAGELRTQLLGSPGAKDIVDPGNYAQQLAVLTRVRVTSLVKKLSRDGDVVTDTDRLVFKVNTGPGWYESYADLYWDTHRIADNVKVAVESLAAEVTLKADGGKFSAQVRVTSAELGDFSFKRAPAASHNVLVSIEDLLWTNFARKLATGFEGALANGAGLAELFSDIDAEAAKTNPIADGVVEAVKSRLSEGFKLEGKRDFAHGQDKLAFWSKKRLYRVSGLLTGIGMTGIKTTLARGARPTIDTAARQVTLALSFGKFDISAKGAFNFNGKTEKFDLVAHSDGGDITVALGKPADKFELLSTVVELSPLTFDWDILELIPDNSKEGVYDAMQAALRGIVDNVIRDQVARAHLLQVVNSDKLFQQLL